MSYGCTTRAVQSAVQFPTVTPEHCGAPGGLHRSTGAGTEFPAKAASDIFEDNGPSRKTAPPPWVALLPVKEHLLATSRGPEEKIAPPWVALLDVNSAVLMAAVQE